MADGSLFVGLGDRLVSLSLTDLQLNFSREVDTFGVHGVHESPIANQLLVHTELKILSVSTSGEIIWEFSGADILLSLKIEHVQLIVEDFNGCIYKLNPVNGKHFSLRKNGRGWIG